MISHLSISHFRNLGLTAPLQIHPSRCNLIVGVNGSGKTSILEAIFFLSHGKSFRSHLPKHYIHYHADSCTVFAQVTDGHTSDDFAINKDKKAKTTLRHNGQNLTSQSPLTKRLPVLVIEPSATSMLDEGSEARRQVLDWLCFYGNASFYSHWSTYQKTLKQRNQLLKNLQKNPSAQGYQDIEAWGVTLEVFAQKIHAIRQAIFGQWLGHFNHMVELLLPQHAKTLSMNYTAGFDIHHSLHSILTERLASDIAAGHTKIGAHRADLAIRLTHESVRHLASNVLSRGEKKLLVTALKLSQLSLLCQQHTPIVLIDDIDAELDLSAKNRLLSVLGSLPCQIFMTSLNPQLMGRLPKAITQEFSCFSICQGVISH